MHAAHLPHPPACLSCLTHPLRLPPRHALRCGALMLPLPARHVILHQAPLLLSHALLGGLLPGLAVDELLAEQGRAGNDMAGQARAG